MIGYCLKYREYRGDPGLTRWRFKKVVDVRVCRGYGSIIYTF